MKLDNQTAFQATALPLMGPDDRSVMTVIVKATFSIEPEGLQLASEQMPIAFGDQFYSREKGSGIRYECDIVPFKPRADIVLCGSAYAPQGRAADCVDVGLKVGQLHKILRVFGKRLWNHCGIFSGKYRATKAQPFLRKAITYTDAFGGMDPTTGEFCAQNPNGKGFYSKNTKDNPAGRPLPCIEDPRNPIRSLQDHPDPAGFGFYNRAWAPRSAYAGTYDDDWCNNRSPRYPKDFDFRYYNGAHPDLQLKHYLRGNETVELVNLTRKGHLKFDLPGVRPLCRIQRYQERDRTTIDLNLDTLFIESDKISLCMLWRGGIELGQLSDADIAQISIMA